MMSRTRERLENIATYVREQLVVTLADDPYNLRLRPETIAKFMELFRGALESARRIGQIHAARPPDPPPRPDVDENAITKRMRVRPPPPPKR